jgi:Tetratricopeptide repeat
LFYKTGQVHRTLGHTYEALKYFNMAISLDPKQATALKVTNTSLKEWYKFDKIK